MKSKQWKSAGLICLVFIGGLSSCTNGGQGSKGDALDAQPIVGSVEILNGDSVWVCNQSALKDTLVLPLSYFADELQIVKLDNRDEALVPVRNVIVSDNYILVLSLIHISEPTRQAEISYAVFCLKKKKNK